MDKKIVWLMILGMGMGMVSGCKTTQKQDKITTLNNKVVALEEKVESLSTRQEQLEQKTSSTEVRSAQDQSFDAPSAVSIYKDSAIPNVNKLSVMQMQTALKKAGYYKGAIDGEKGHKTKVAIKKFQREHGLKADGVVGKETTRELKKYLD